MTGTTGFPASLLYCNYQSSGITDGAIYAYDEVIDALFTAIEEYIDRPKIPSDYLSAIDAFMNNEKDYLSEDVF